MKNKTKLKELSLTELENINGGGTPWYQIGYHIERVGNAIGHAAGDVYNGMKVIGKIGEMIE